MAENEKVTDVLQPDYDQSVESVTRDVNTKIKEAEGTMASSDDTSKKTAAKKTASSSS